MSGFCAEAAADPWNRRPKVGEVRVNGVHNIETLNLVQCGSALDSQGHRSFIEFKSCKGIQDFHQF